MRDIIVLLLTLTLFLANCSSSRQAEKPDWMAPHKTRFVSVPQDRTVASVPSEGPDFSRQ